MALLGTPRNRRNADLRSARAVVRTAHIVDPSRPDDANDFRYRPELHVIDRSPGPPTPDIDFQDYKNLGNKVAFPLSSLKLA